MLVVANKSGRLANRLFLFGHLIGFAVEHGERVANIGFYEYSSHFRSTSRDLFCRFPPPTESRSMSLPTPQARKLCHLLVSRCAFGLAKCNFLPGVVSVLTLSWEEKCIIRCSAFLKLARHKKLVLLRGWRFRDYASFDKHAAVIREYFRPIPEIEHNVAVLIQNCRSQADIVVGIHVRYGDYREFQGGIYCYALDKYASVMRKLEQMLPDKRVLFLICSNEALDAEAFEGLHIRFSTNHLVEDLYALAQCDYICGPPSTFSHWASFYGQAPLLSLMTPDTPVSLSQFRVAGGMCDLVKDIDAYPSILPE